jgi:hypothetical protein
MGHTKASKLLNQNLKEEQATLKKMQAFSKKLKPENLGMDEDEEGDQDESSDNEVSQDEMSDTRSKTPKKANSGRGSRRVA